MDSELLSNHDIDFFLSLIGIKVTVLSKDLLSNMQLDGFYVINLDDSFSGRGGTHWVAFIKKNKINLYYDSFGLPPPTSLVGNIQKKNDGSIIYNIDQIQHFDSIYCGWFCILFIFLFVHNEVNTVPKAKKYVNEFNNLFSLKNRKSNDQKLKGYIKNVFI